MIGIAEALKVASDKKALERMTKDKLQEINKVLTSTLNAKLRKGQYSKSATVTDKALFDKFYSDTGSTQQKMGRVFKKTANGIQFAEIDESIYIDNITKMRDYLEPEVKNKGFSKKTYEMLDKFDKLPSQVSWSDAFQGIAQPKGSPVNNYIYENFVGNDSFDAMDLYKIVQDAENGNQGAKEMYDYFMRGNKCDNIMRNLKMYQ